MSEQDHRVALITGAPRASAPVSSPGTGGGAGRSWPRPARSGPPGIRRCSPSTGDISDPATTDRIISGALERFGRIDTLINNAGVFIAKPFTDYTADDYAAVVGVNLTGFFWLTQRTITVMLERRGGHIVNISTTLADYADSSTPCALTALTKGGLAAATRSLAIEYASRGIRVNAVALGIIQTPEHAPEAYDALAGRHPLGRVGQVSDVVDGILFLESSPFITGEILHIDGGQVAGH